MKKIGFLGLSHIHTQSFAKALIKRKNIKVIGLWDSDIKLSKKYSKFFKCNYFKNYKDVLHIKELDAVIICSETNLHEKLIYEASQNKKHIFVEKPIGFGHDDSLRMAKIIENSKVIFQTGYFFRSKSVVRKIKELIIAGSFGKISRIEINNSHDGIFRNIFRNYQWMTNKNKAGVGAFGDLGTHALDLLLWFKKDLISVSATFNNITGKYKNIEESGTALFKFKSGTIAKITSGWIDFYQPIDIMISGTKGFAYTANDKIYFKSKGSNIKQITKLPKPLPHALDLFLDSILTNRKKYLIKPIEAAIRSSVMETIYKSEKSKYWKRIKIIK